METTTAITIDFFGINGDHELTASFKINKKAAWKFPREYKKARKVISEKILPKKIDVKNPVQVLCGEHVGYFTIHFKSANKTDYTYLFTKLP